MISISGNAQHALNNLERTVNLVSSVFECIYVRWGFNSQPRGKVGSFSSRQPRGPGSTDLRTKDLGHSADLAPR